MSLKPVRPHYNFVPEYQVSSFPYLTSSTAVSGGEEINFGFVTRWLVVANNSGGVLTIGVTENGMNGQVYDNFFTIPDGSITPRLEMKTTKIFVKGAGGSAYSVFAGLTNVEQDAFINLTGSDDWQGVG